MAKSLLLNTLFDFLGPYVENMQVENLKIGVWSGKVELHDLRLRTDFFDVLNMPFALIHGMMKNFSVKVPWTALQSKPVKVSIDGIFLQVSPLNVDVMSMNDYEQRALVDLKLKLRMAGNDSNTIDSIQVNDEGSVDNKMSFMKKLMTNILDNIEITISNLHIRYEDSTSVPGSCFAAGIVLESIKISTMDSDWKEKFVVREVDASINKFGDVSNFGVYWCPKTQPLPTLRTAWEQHMLELIRHSTHSTKLKKKAMASTTTVSKTPNALEKRPRLEKDADRDDDITYIIAPARQSIKIVHCNIPTRTTPGLSLSFDISNVGIDLDYVQIRQMIRTGRKLMDFGVKKQMALSRPRRGPLLQPRKWWKYAYALVTGKPIHAISQVCEGPRGRASA